MITFPEYVAKYANKVNPATKKVWQLAEILADNPEVKDYILANGGQPFLSEWHQIVLDENMRKWQLEGVGPTDAELVAVFETIHPNKVLIRTPMGMIYVDKGAAPPVKLGEMTYEEFITRFLADTKGNS